jgi:hypothetical protein
MERRRRGAVGLIIIVAVILIIAMLLLLPTTQSWLKEMLGGQNSPATSGGQVHLRYAKTMVVSANGGTIIDSSLTVAKASDLLSNTGIAMQDVTLNLEPAGYQTIDRNGSAILEWNTGQMQGSQQYTVTLTYDLHQTRVTWDVKGDTSGTISQIPSSIKARYLVAEWKISYSETQIQQLSQQIVAGKTNVYDQLQAIYQWMVDNVDYQTLSGSGDPKSSLETLQSKLGDCDDQSILFCSLARAAGIPAWLQMGSLYDESQGQVVGHGWVQTYIPLATGGGYNVTIDVVNRDFLVWTPIHILDYTDNGNGVDLREYYRSFFCTYDPSTYLPGTEPGMSTSMSVLSFERTA